MKKIRRLVYRLGFRPKPGSIFFSPSLSLLISVRDGLKKREHDLGDIERLLKPDIRQIILDSFDERKIGE